MKKAYQVFRLFPLLLSILFYSCEKNAVETETHPEELGPYESLADFYDQNGVETLEFIINPTQPYTISVNGGLEIFLPGNSLYNAAGQQPTGLVTVHLKKIYTLKNMVLSHVPSESNGNTLETAGMIYIDFYSNNEHYKALYTSIIMPSQGALPGMHVFKGVEDADIGVNWMPADTNTNYITTDSTGIDPSYFMTVDSLGGWVSCARLYTAGPVTNVSVISQVDSWRNETVDIAVYLLFPSINSCTNVDNTEGPQTVTAYNIPEGMDAWAVAIGVGRISQKSYFGMVNFTVNTVQPFTVTLIQADEEILTALQAL